MLPKGKHCLSCRNCVRVIRRTEALILDQPFQVGAQEAPIWCKLGYWGELDDGRPKTYHSHRSAAKSQVLRTCAERCDEYDDEP